MTDTDSDICDLTTDVRKFVTKSLVKFRETYKRKDRDSSSDSEDIYLSNAVPKNKNKFQRTDSGSISSNNKEDEVKPGKSSSSSSPVKNSKQGKKKIASDASTSSTTNNVADQLDFLAKEVGECLAECTKPKRKCKRRRSKRLKKRPTPIVPRQTTIVPQQSTKPQQTVPDADSDADTEPDESAHDPNPPVEVYVTWQLFNKKLFKLRKFDKLQIIIDYFVKTIAADPELLFFTIDDKEVDLRNETYVSLRLKGVVIEGTCLSESYRERTISNYLSKVGTKLNVRYGTNKSLQVYVTMEDEMDYVYAQVMKVTELNFDKFKIVFDGKTVKHRDNISYLELEDDDQLDVVYL